jgi:hypothetical protein
MASLKEISRNLLAISAGDVDALARSTEQFAQDVRKSDPNRVSRDTSGTARQDSTSALESHQTILEMQLEQICLTLNRMKKRLHRVPMLDHMSEAERAELTAALHRAQGKLAELDNAIRRND